VRAERRAFGNTGWAVASLGTNAIVLNHSRNHGLASGGAGDHTIRIGTDMGSVKKKRRKKIAQHKRRKHLKALRHKKK
jgi:hypothetical protein